MIICSIEDIWQCLETFVPVIDWGGILASGILRPDHPTMHKRPPYNKELSSQLSTMLRLRNDALRAQYFPLLRQDGFQYFTQYPVNVSLADGNRYYSSLLWVPSILFNPFRWFFSWPPGSFLTHMPWSELCCILEGDPLRSVEFSLCGAFL